MSKPNDTVYCWFVLGLPVIVIFLASGSFEQGYLLSVFLAGLLSVPVLYLFLYRPNFGSIYLPRLETIKEAYERKELEQLEKCRKAQLSNQALCLIFYVFDQVSGISGLQANDTKYRFLRLDTGYRKLHLYLDITDSLYNVNPRMRKTVFEIEEQYRHNFELLQKANRMNAEAENLKMEAKKLDGKASKK